MKELFTQMSSMMYAVVILFVSYLAYKRRSLTMSGAIAAFLLGAELR